MNWNGTCGASSEVRGYPYKRSHLVALRATKITASDSPLDVVAGRAVKPIDECCPHLSDAEVRPVLVEIGQ